MYPILFRIPGTDFPVTSFGLMMALSFVAGAWIGGRQAERYGMRAHLMWDTVVWVAVAGIVGAKLYFLASGSGHAVDHCPCARLSSGVTGISLKRL